MNSSESLPLITIIADATESASHYWRDTTRIIADLIGALPESSVNGVHLLGSSLRWGVEDWRADMPLPPQAKDSGSFIAPVINTLQAARTTSQAVVLVGAGEVFDLADWVSYGPTCVVINVGSEPLRGTVEALFEVDAKDLERVVDFLKNVPTDALRRFIPVASGFVKHSWLLDHTGYPMIFVPRVNAYVHLFPLAKPQFEQFLAQARLPNHGDNYYESILKLNPRLTPMAQSFRDYEQLFITGLLPSDVRDYVRWHGGGIRALTIEEWRTAHRWLESQETSVLPAELESKLTPTARTLWNGLREELQPRTLLDFALMRNGVVEWVSGIDKKFVGLGKPRTQFHPNLFDPLTDLITATTETHRSKYWGLRLLQPRL